MPCGDAVQRRRVLGMEREWRAVLEVTGDERGARFVT